METGPVKKYVCDELNLREEMWVVEQKPGKVLLHDKNDHIHMEVECNKSLKRTVETMRFLFKEVYGIIL